MKTKNRFLLLKISLHAQLNSRCITPQCKFLRSMRDAKKFKCENVWLKLGSKVQVKLTENGCDASASLSAKTDKDCNRAWWSKNCCWLPHNTQSFHINFFKKSQRWFRGSVEDSEGVLQVAPQISTCPSSFPSHVWQSLSKCFCPHPDSSFDSSHKQMVTLEKIHDNL